MDQTLKNLVAETGISKSVFLIGWKQVDEIPVFYALSSCLILPSVSEPWGLVVNEAMASSLPVLVSNKCGCVSELCFRGVNGFDFNPYNEKEITDVMLKMSSDDCERMSMSRVSLDLIGKYTLDNYVASLSDCIASLRKYK
jgi:glycosyltransferase involved in cell wall biosynthesis